MTDHDQRSVRRGCGRYDVVFLSDVESEVLAETRGSKDPYGQFFRQMVKWLAGS